MHNLIVPYKFPSICVGLFFCTTKNNRFPLTVALVFHFFTVYRVTQTRMSQNQNEKWLTRARELIKIKPVEVGSKVGCSGSSLEPCATPIKQIFGGIEQAFLFDEKRCIPFVTKCYLNFVESIGYRELGTPSEYEFYEKHAHIEDIQELIEKAIPVVAIILRDENKLDKLGFHDQINKLFCFKMITEDEVKELARSPEPADKPDKLTTLVEAAADVWFGSESNPSNNLIEVVDADQLEGLFTPTPTDKMRKEYVRLVRQELSRSNYVHDSADYFPKTKNLKTALGGNMRIVPYIMDVIIDPQKLTLTAWVGRGGYTCKFVDDDLIKTQYVHDSKIIKLVEVAADIWFGPNSNPSTNLLGSHPMVAVGTLLPIEGIREKYITLLLIELSKSNRIEDSSDYSAVSLVLSAAVGDSTGMVPCHTFVSIDARQFTLTTCKTHGWVDRYKYQFVGDDLIKMSW
jgi:hypothetical protein